jgi:fermentation-respiration switch protein FrsA (DUF1100 family)
MDERHTPFRSRRAALIWSFLVLVLLAAYAVNPFAYFEERAIFPREYAPQPPSKPPYLRAELLFREVDGGRVEAIFVPTDGPTPAPLVVYFHGNAEIQDFKPLIVEQYGRLGFNVLLPEYRGYSRSGGRPSQQAIQSDAAYFVDQIARRPSVAPGRLVIHGRSLGGAAAADLSRVRRPQAMILESTFTSIPAMLWEMGIPGVMVKNGFHTDEAVKAAEFPMLIFHGDMDDVVPVSHGRQLRDLNPRVAYVEYQCAHNDLPGAARDDYWQRIAAFVKGI